MLRGVRRSAGQRDHPFDRDAQPLRHRALHRGAPQLRAEDLDADLVEPRADGSSLTRRDRPRRRPTACPGGAGCGAPARTGSRPGSPSGWTLPEIVGRLLAARGIGIDAAADFLEPTLRALLPDPSLLIDMDVAADRLADAVRRGRDGRGVRRLRRRRRVQRGADGRVPARPGLPRASPRAGPDQGGLRAERAGAGGAGCARGARLIVCVDCGTAAADGAGRGGRSGGRDRAGPPQGGGAAAADPGDGQSEPAGLTAPA